MSADLLATDTDLAPYSARDNLEVMHLATRYNAALAALVRNVIQPHDHVLDYGAGAGAWVVDAAASRCVARGSPKTCAAAPMNWLSLMAFPPEMLAAAR